MVGDRLARRSLLAGIVALVAGCSGSDAGGVASPPQAIPEQLVVTITPRVDSLLLGSTRQLSADVRTTTGLARTVPVEFTSLSPAIAIVSGSSVTAIATGEARIVARAGAAADTATLVVTPPLLELRVEPSAVSAALGDTIAFTASIVAPNGAATKATDITWALSDSVAAQLVGGGSVTTLAEGELLVLAQVGGVTAAAAVKVQAPQVGSVSISPSNLAVAVGASAQLVADVRDGRGRVVRRADVTWESSKPSIATVNAEGVVNAIAAGGAVITATVAGYVASAAVNVASAAAASVAITLPNDSLGTGRSMQATATPMDASGNPISGRPLAWQSSNPAVATINSSGQIVGIAAGATTISVICDGKISSQKLTVAVPTPTSVVVVPSTAQLFIGSTSALAAEVRDQFGIVLTGPSVTWSSTAPAVASVNSTGQVVAQALGTATIRASSGTLSGTSAVTVQNVPVASVTLSPPSASLEQGTTMTMTATPRDSAGNVLPNRPVSWNSSAPAIASVSASGELQGIAEGSATVTATVEGKSVSASVTVTPPPPPVVSTVVVTLNSPVLSVGQATTAKAYAYDEVGQLVKTNSVIFSSSDPATATVSNDGRVKGLRAGSTTITAEVDGESGIASVTVQPSAPLPVDLVLLSAPTTSLSVGDSTQLSVELRDSTGTVVTGRTISFTSSATSIVSVTATGVVRAGSEGTATVTATSEGKSASLTLVVAPASTTPPPAPAPVASVSVSLAASALTVGQTTQGTVTLRDSANNVLTGRTLAWSSSNTAVATVTQSGTVTAVSAGSASISVQSEGKTGSASLTVTAPAPATVKTVKLTLSATSIMVGGTSQVTATARDSSGAVVSGNPVTWAVTSGASVASLSGGTASTSTATGASAGTATISATVDGVSATASLTVQAVPPPPTSVAQPALPTLLSFNYPSVTGKSWFVKAGDNLQTVLNNAQRGDEIVIQAGATFSGTFTLPAKSGTPSNGWILIRSDKSAQLPPMGTRVTPAHESLMPKIASANAAAALQTAAGASGWWISGIEITLDPALSVNYGLVLLGASGSKQNTMSMVPTDIVLDRVYVHASPTTPTSRCIALNSARTQITDSFIFDCHGKGFDTQAIAGWNGPGPFKIVNNTLAGAGENIMFGGSDPAIANLIPSDIEIRRNYVYTPASWKTTWTKKNLFELKNAQRLLIEGNVFDGSWADAQVGYAFVLKSANQGGGCNWCASRDITIRNNIIRNSGAGFNLTGREGSNPYPVGELLARVLIEQNIMEDFNTGIYTGEAKFIQVLQNLSDLTVRNNTMTAPGAFTQFFSVGSKPAATNVDFQNNIVTHGQYGLFSSASGTGEGALNNLAGLVVWKNYVMIGSQRSGYPNGTFVPDVSTALATGRGANQAAVNAATAGVIIP